MAALTGLITGDDPAAWTSLGFSVDGGSVRVGGLRIVCDGSGGGPRGLAYGAPSTDPPTRHANGAVAVDHLVMFTETLDATVADLARAGWEERRRAGPPAVPVAMAFVRLGDKILEVAERPGAPARLWGLTVVVSDLDACVRDLGDRVGQVKHAVQSGRMIATARPAHGFETALAFMTPRP